MSDDEKDSEKRPWYRNRDLLFNVLLMLGLLVPMIYKGYLWWEETRVERLSDTGPKHTFTSQEQALTAIENGTIDREKIELVISPEIDQSVVTFQSSKEDGGLHVLHVSEQERSVFLNKLEALDIKIKTSLVSSPEPVSVAVIDGIVAIICTILVLVVLLVAMKWYLKNGGSLWNLKTQEDNIGLDFDVESSPEERFSDYAGNYKLVSEMKQLVEQIKAVRQGDLDPKEIPRGYLLEGPTGTGKSFLARVVAGEAGCTVVIINSGKLFSSVWQGAYVRETSRFFEMLRAQVEAGTEKLREAEGASGKEQEVVIAVLEEVDAISRSRSNEAIGNSKNYEMGVNTLLHELDSSDPEKNNGIIFIGTTNKPDSIDDAFVRPGRMDQQRHVGPLATVAERLDLFEKVASKIEQEKGLTIARREDLEDMAKTSPPKAAAFLSATLKRARKSAEMAKRTEITSADIWDAFLAIEVGEVQDIDVSQEKQRLVMAHEDGHALLARACGVKAQVRSVVPRGSSLGHVVVELDALLDPPTTRDELLKFMLISAGGRAGEIVYGGTGNSTLGVLGEGESDFGRIVHYAKLFVSAGFDDGTFGLPLHSTDRGDLTERDKLRIEFLGDLVVLEAIEILRAIEEHDGAFRAILTGHISQEGEAPKREWFGPETDDYYSKHLSKESDRVARDMVRDFLARLDDVLREHPLWQTSINQEMLYPSASRKISS